MLSLVIHSLWGKVVGSYYEVCIIDSPVRKKGLLGIMGQNQCCAEKQFKNNEEYLPNLRTRNSRTVPKKAALDSLASIVRLKMNQIPPFQPKKTTLLPKGVPSDSYEEVTKPKGYYHGEWSADKFHGGGQFFFKDGSFYKGTFRQGSAEGQGRYIFNNGCIYEGEIHNNEASGQGTYLDPFQNYYYTGQWIEDVPHGDGKEKFANGSYYEGDFVMGVKQGSGHYVCESGVYEGEFKAGNFNGEGTFTYTDNRVYKGGWLEGLLSGFGIFTWPDGNRYEGEYLAGVKQGRGTFFFANGKIFRGRWSKGVKHGPGQLKINNQVIRGVWKSGELQTVLDENDYPEPI